MSKALWASALISLALSGAAFAQSSSESMSSGGTELRGNAAMQITSSDCQMLTVESARGACERSTQARDAGTGATGNTGAAGAGKGGKRDYKRQKSMGQRD